MDRLADTTAYGANSSATGNPIRQQVMAMITRTGAGAAWYVRLTRSSPPHPGAGPGANPGPSGGISLLRAAGVHSRSGIAHGPARWSGHNQMTRRILSSPRPLLPMAGGGARADTAMRRSG